jgi:hypothetical protein
MQPVLDQIIQGAARTGILQPDSAGKKSAPEVHDGVEHDRFCIRLKHAGKRPGSYHRRPGGDWWEIDAQHVVGRHTKIGVLLRMIANAGKAQPSLK